MTDFSAFANRTMKVTRDDETRRGHLSISQCTSTAEAFSAIEAAVAALFVISPIPMVGYRITYPDTDGDLCTLTPDTVSDFVENAPEGILRLTLTQTSTRGNGGSAEEDALPSPMEVDAAASGASPSSGTSPDTDDELRAKLQGLSQRIPPGMRPFLLTMVQGMDPSALHHLLGCATAHMQQCAGLSSGPGAAEQNHDSQEASKVLHTLSGMEPSAVHALVLEVLRSGMDAEGSTSCGPSANNPLEAMLGAFLGGKGCGKAFGKGCGKRGYPDGSHPQNPMDFLGPLLAGKGFGKGGGMADAPMPHPLESLLSGFGKGGCAQGPANHDQPPNPMQTLFETLIAGKGAGKGFAPETAGSMPFTSPSMAPACAPASDDIDTARDAFEESVNDLLNMGLVTDRQTARQLLTQHGDISSVVALLAD